MDWSEVFNLLLAILAADVVLMRFKGYDAWWVISLYWITVTFKNILAFIDKSNENWKNQIIIEKRPETAD